MTTNAQFWAETIESTFLMFGILALQDISNFGAERFLPLGLFFLIFGLGACFGFKTGYAMNLARDFGPRLMSYIVGYVSCFAPFTTFISVVLGFVPVRIMTGFCPCKAMQSCEQQTDAFILVAGRSDYPYQYLSYCPRHLLIRTLGAASLDCRQLLFLGSNSRAIHWLHIWWFLIRRFHLHRCEPDQHTLDRTEEVDSTGSDEEDRC